MTKHGQCGKGRQWRHSGEKGFPAAATALCPRGLAWEGRNDVFIASSLGSGGQKSGMTPVPP